MGIKNSSPNVVESFFIQHSLPRFPNTPESIFDTNVYHRAQHFFCTSMKDIFEGQEDHTHDIQPNYVQNCNFFKILRNYAAVIKVNSIQTSNYQYSFKFRPVFNALKNELNNDTTKLSSFLIKSTGEDNEPISIHVLAKSPDNHIDIYDDVTSLLTIHHDDYNTDSGEHKTGHPNDDKTAMLMITQSHTDPATLGINQKVLVDREDFFATVHILNSAYIHFPSENKNVSFQQHSMYADHSKWSINLIYGSEGEFPATFCFYDLNRSNKQAKRGGGAFCLNSSFAGSTFGSTAIWNMFMSFNPKPTDMARFNNAPVNDILSQIDPFVIDPSPVTFNTRSPHKFPRRKSRKSSGSSVITPSTLSSTRESLTSLISTSASEFADGFDADVDDVTENQSEFEEERKVEEETQILSNIKMSYLKFSKDEVDESGKHQLLILHQHASKAQPIEFDVVPCPFRYEKDSKNVNENSKVPALVGFKINSYFCQYGPEKLNKVLNRSFNLAIFSTKDTNSPNKGHENLSKYGSHVKVEKMKNKKRKSLENAQQIEDENQEFAISSSFPLDDNQDFRNVFLDDYYSSSDSPSISSNNTADRFFEPNRPTPIKRSRISQIIE